MTQGIMSASGKILEAVRDWQKDVKNAETTSFTEILLKTGTKTLNS